MYAFKISHVHQCLFWLWFLFGHTISCAVTGNSVLGTSKEGIFQSYCGLCNFLNVLAPFHSWSCHDWHLQNAGASCCNWTRLSPVANPGFSLRCQASTSLHDAFNPGGEGCTFITASSGFSQCQALALWLLHDFKTNASRVTLALPTFSCQRILGHLRNTAFVYWLMKHQNTLTWMMPVSYSLLISQLQVANINQ